MISADMKALLDVLQPAFVSIAANMQILRDKAAQPTAWSSDDKAAAADLAAKATALANVPLA